MEDQASKSRIQPIPDSGYVRLNVILQNVPVCASTWWNWVRSGRAPKPVRLSPGVTVWDARQVRAMMEASAQSGYTPKPRPGAQAA